MLEGKRSKRNNDRLLERAQDKAASLWPDVPIHVILPTIICDHEGNENLPVVQCMTYWESLMSVKSPEMTGSLLVTIHYQDHIVPHLSPDIEKAVKSLDWRQLAADFQL